MTARNKGDSGLLDAHVSALVRLICKGKLTPNLRRQLQDRWGVSTHGMSDRVSEAFRHVRLLRGADQLNQDLDRKLAQIEATRAEALKREKAVYERDGESTTVRMVPDPDFRAVALFDRLYLEGIGALVKRTERVSAPKGSIEEMKQRRDLAKQALAELEVAISEQEDEKGAVH